MPSGKSLRGAQEQEDDCAGSPRRLREEAVTARDHWGFVAHTGLPWTLEFEVIDDQSYWGKCILQGGKKRLAIDRKYSNNQIPKYLFYISTILFDRLDLKSFPHRCCPHIHA